MWWNILVGVIANMVRINTSKEDKKWKKTEDKTKEVV